MKDLSPKMIIFTLVFGIFLFSLVAILFSEYLFQGGKIAVIEEDGLIIEVRNATYQQDLITFSYTVESLEPIEVFIEPIVHQDVRLIKEAKVLEKKINPNKNAFSETYRVVADNQPPTEISLSFNILNRETRTIFLSQ